MAAPGSPRASREAERKSLNSLVTARALYSSRVGELRDLSVMRQAFWSDYGRGAWRVLAAASVALCMAGCSSGTSSRFDLPSFGFADSSSGQASADPSSTASIPVPPESVYASAGSYQGQVDRSTLPPP